VFLAIVSAVVLWWLYRSLRITTRVGMLGRGISASMAIFVAWIMGATLLSGNPIGTLLTTLFYVTIGCGLQFVIGTGLAFLCSQPIAGKSFFRVVFFIPLMITPLGVGFAMRMVADSSKGPLLPLFGILGVGDWIWSADAWSARFVMMICDSWQWIPFIFICMLAALENVPRDHVEAAQVDGASSVQIFREIIWPQIVPVAVTVLLIRMIEAFKIVDLPNIMTGGGPGTSTESMTLHSMYVWRANDVGTSAAVAYLLLILTVVVCASFFNYVVLDQLRKAHA
jgi:multiple sugar transport system permease protein